MKLFVIFNDNDTNVSIKEVEITKETEKQVSIKCDGINRKILIKAAIGTYLNEGHIYAYSAEEALTLWNNYHKEEADCLEKQVNHTRSLIKEVSAQSLLK